MTRKDNSTKKHALGRQPLPKCARAGCENRLTPDDIAKGWDHCSEQCYLDDVPDAMGGPEDPL